MAVFRLNPQHARRLRAGAVGSGLLLALWSPAAPAAERAHPGPVADPTIVVDSAACRWVRRHEPRDDVIYRPNRDVVNGRPVAPADLPGEGGPVMPDRFEIGISQDIARTFGIPAVPDAESEVRIGTVTIEGNRVLFNGQPVGSEAERELVALCQFQEHVGR
ncbi:MAG TPA: hypothetical protein VED40_07425 [Azospirillaceae bacterium]|nr:hypothetical protein [Azospirillaceae bacterium]